MSALDWLWRTRNPKPVSLFFVIFLFIVSIHLFAMIYFLMFVLLPPLFVIYSFNVCTFLFSIDIVSYLQYILYVYVCISRHSIIIFQINRLYRKNKKEKSISRVKFSLKGIICHPACQFTAKGWIETTLNKKITKKRPISFRSLLFSDNRGQMCKLCAWHLKKNSKSRTARESVEE